MFLDISVRSFIQIGLTKYQCSGNHAGKNTLLFIAHTQKHFYFSIQTHMCGRHRDREKETRGNYKGRSKELYEI